MPREGHRLRTDSLQTIDSYVSVDMIAFTIFQDMVRIADGYLEAYQGDLYRDAIKLHEFEREIITRFAKRDRDWFTYKCVVCFGMRPTGTDYLDSTGDAAARSWWQAAQRQSNRFACQYSIIPNWDEGSGNTVAVKRYISRAPSEWNLLSGDE